MLCMTFTFPNGGFLSVFLMLNNLVPTISLFIDYLLYASISYGVFVLK